MDRKRLLDLYIDFLLSSTRQASSTLMSEVLDSSISHDQITRMLDDPTDEIFGQKAYWKRIKPLVREVEHSDGCLIIDDFIEEKPHSKENELICYHHSHLHGRLVKGIQITHLHYSVTHMGKEVSLPVGFELVRKTECIPDAQTGKEKRISLRSKQEMFRDLLKTATHFHHILYRFVLADTWYASVANMIFVQKKLKKDFIFGLKSNRNVALSQGQLRRKEFVKLADLSIEPGEVRPIWLKDLPFPLYLAKEVYVNEDQSTGILFLVTARVDLTYQQIISIYPNRWKIEVAHKSVKNNASLASSPTKVPRTQANHIFAAFCALVQLEWIKLKTSANHFAFKRKLYIKACRAAFKELQHVKYSISHA
ncbi:MAG: transposase [Bacteroidia bacterium]